MTLPPIDPGSITILNVDDTPAARYARSHILRAAGYRVTEAETGEAGLRLARETKPHLTVIDVRLPDIDGMQMCRTLKTDPATSSMMVLLVSAVRVQPAERVSGLDHGADGYLIEPIEPDVLLATVASLLRLHRSEERVQLALTATNDAVWDWDIVHDSHIWNLSGADLLGWPEIAEKAQPASWWLDRVHPDDRQRVADGFHAALDDHAVTRWQDEYRFLTGAGDYAWIVDRGCIVRNEQGRPIRMIGAMRNVTEQRRSEEALRRSRQHLELISDAVPALIAYIDRSRRYRTCNQAYETWFGIGRDRIVGQRVRDVLGERAWTTIEPRIDEAFAGRTVSFETQLDYLIAGPRWIQACYTPDRDERGDVAGIVVMVHDITARKRTEQALAARGGRLERLYKLASAVNRVEKPDELYGMALDAILACLKADRASILLFDDRGTMRFAASRGLSEGYRLAVEGHSPWKRGQTGATPIVIPDIETADFEPPLKEVIRKEGVRALGFIPLNYDGQVIGKFMVYFDRPHLLSEDDLGLAGGIADQLATGIERKRIAAALRESEERFRTLAEAVPSFLFETDAAGRNIWTSDGWCRFTGQSQEQVAGQGWADALHPEDRAANIEGWNTCMRTGAPFVSRQRLRRADGRYAWVMAHALPVRDREGKISRWVGSVTDVDDMVRVEESLRENEERLRLAMTGGRMGAWDIDIPTGQVTWDTQQCELFGRPPDRPVRNMEEFYALVHPDDTATVKAASDAAELTGRFSAEFRIVHPDGAVRWIAGQGVTAKDHQGRPSRMVGVNYDITERKETHRTLERFAEDLERLVGERTSDLMRSQERLRALATELNLTEQRERKKLATVLHDHLAQLLVLCRLKLGQTKRIAGIAPPCVDLITSIEEIVGEALKFTRTLVADLAPPVLHDLGLPAALHWLRDYMSRYDLAVTVSIDECRDTALPEEQKVLLFQSVRELLMNCAKHSGAAQARLSLGMQGRNLRIRVEDRGKGFSSGAAAESDQETGGKFGLFSIRERMRALGGSFEIDSSPGNGTRATLTLPLDSRTATGSKFEVLGSKSHLEPRMSNLERHTSTLEPRTSNVECHQPSARIRVLLADDHGMVRQGLRSMLESYADVQVVGEAATGEEAIAGVVKWRPAVVVMDVNMPRLNGIEATARIKSQYPEIAVIGLSVRLGEETRQAMLKAGAAALLTKEGAVDELYQAINEALQRGRVSPRA